MFRALITASAGLLLLSTSHCEAAPLASHQTVQVGDSAGSLMATYGRPDATTIVNTEGSPLKGELWVYSGTGSDQEYLVRDGMVRWIGDVPHRATESEPTRVAKD
jgi:hypothetical protein